MYFEAPDCYGLQGYVERKTSDIDFRAGNLTQVSCHQRFNNQVLAARKNKNRRSKNKQDYQEFFHSPAGSF